MSDEDADLKDVLVRSLNETGILPRLQAQLRAAVYLALEKHNYSQKIPPANAFLRNICSTEDGLIIVSLIAEFLSYANLESTLEVFKHEAELDRLTLADRPVLHSLLSLDDTTAGATIVKLISARRSGVQNSENHVPLKKKDAPDNSALIHGYEQTVDESTQKNGYRDAVASDALTDNDSQPSSDRSAAVPFSNLQNKKAHESDFVDPLLQATPNGSGPDHSGLRSNGRESDSSSFTQSAVVPGLRVNDLQPTPSSHDPEYQDDFESPRSVSSSKALSTASSLADGIEQRQTTPHSIPDMSARGDVGDLRSANTSGNTTPVTRFSLQSPGPNELPTSRNDSRSNSPSVIRLYTRFKKPSPSNEMDSDVDGEDEISELVKELEYSGEEDTIDQTIDSDESLCLDHVEDVIVPKKPVSPSA